VRRPQCSQQSPTELAKTNQHLGQVARIDPTCSANCYRSHASSKIVCKGVYTMVYPFRKSALKIDVTVKSTV